MEGTSRDSGGEGGCQKGNRGSAEIRGKLGEAREKCAGNSDRLAI